MKRIILDEGVPKPLARALRSHDVDAAEFPNDWKQLSDGALLDRVERDGFDVLITCDKNMPMQQSLKKRNLAVLVLEANRLKAVLPLAGRIVEILPALEPRHFTSLPISGQFKQLPY